MKKILYVDVDPEGYCDSRSYREHSEREEHVVDELREHYDVELIYDLHSPKVDSALEKEGFDLFLTHLPHNSRDFTYGQSLERLRGLVEKHKASGMRVVVYTGADAKSVSDKVLKGFGVSAIVRKEGGDKYSDSRRLKRVLKGVLG